MKNSLQGTPLMFGFLDSFGGVGEVLKLRLPDGQTLAAARRPAAPLTMRDYRASYLKPKQTVPTSARAKR